MRRQKITIPKELVENVERVKNVRRVVRAKVAESLRIAVTKYDGTVTLAQTIVDAIKPFLCEECIKRLEE